MRMTQLYSRRVASTILFVSSFFVLASPLIAQDDDAPATGGLTNPAVAGPWGQDAAAANSGATFTTIIVHFWNVLIQVGALAVLLYFLWGAIEWITSAGDKGKLESARNRITQAVIGLIVLAASTAILILVQDFLNICVIQIGTSCTNWMQ